MDTGSLFFLEIEAYRVVPGKVKDTFAEDRSKTVSVWAGEELDGWLKSVFAALPWFEKSAVLFDEVKAFSNSEFRATLSLAINDFLPEKAQSQKDKTPFIVRTISEKTDNDCVLRLEVEIRRPIEEIVSSKMMLAAVSSAFVKTVNSNPTLAGVETSSARLSSHGFRSLLPQLEAHALKIKHMNGSEPSKNRRGV